MKLTFIKSLSESLDTYQILSKKRHSESPQHKHFRTGTLIRNAVGAVRYK